MFLACLLCWFFFFSFQVAFHLHSAHQNFLSFHLFSFFSSFSWDTNWLRNFSFPFSFFFLISQEIGSPISLLIPPPPAQPFYCNEIAPCSWWQYQEDNPWRNKFNIKLSVNSMRKEDSWRLDNSLYFIGIKHRVICPGLSITQAEKRKRENYGE